MFYVRGNLVSLNLVLGLMDSAESPHDAYQWATSGLIHACRTNDDELCHYIEHSLHKQGYRPYQSEEEHKREKEPEDEDYDEEDEFDEDDEDEKEGVTDQAQLASHGQTTVDIDEIQNSLRPTPRVGQMPATRVQSESVVRLKLKMALEELFAMKDDDGKPLFCQKNHWWVVYRLFIDHRVLNIRENKYEQFIELVNRLEVGNMEVELNKTTLSNISQEDTYRKPFVKWTVPVGEGKRKVTAFNRMYEIASRLHRILTESLKG